MYVYIYIHTYIKGLGFPLIPQAGRLLAGLGARSADHLGRGLGSGVPIPSVKQKQGDKEPEPGLADDTDVKTARKGGTGAGHVLGGTTCLTLLV